MKNEIEKNLDLSRVRERNETLERARRRLKDEFVGIDSIIDGIVETVQSWFIVPEMQKRPLIINLWGMTGVGKTAVAGRLAELLGFADRFYRYNMDSDSAATELINQLADLHYFGGPESYIIVLDEFQKCRTKNEIGDEIETQKMKNVWDFLDSGFISITGIDMYRSAESIYGLYRRIEDCLNEGVHVEKGTVISGLTIFRRIMGSYLLPEEKGKKGLRFIPNRMYGLICGSVPELFLLEDDLDKALLNMDGLEILDFIRLAYRRTFRAQIADCTKALVFVIGNLDEAFTMSGEFNPDLSADEFLKRSLKITLPVIKNALQKRFRNEQIARLGNIHFIYAAFGKKEFKGLIKKKLSFIEKEFHEFTGMILNIDDSVLDVIYREGVYPSMGVRPVLSTINRIVESRLGLVCVELGLRGITPDRVSLSIASGRLRFDYFFRDRFAHRMECPYVPELENLRLSREDDKQAVIAVHEAGHVVLSCLLLGTIPEIARSVSAGAETEGFVSLSSDELPHRKGELKGRIAVFLGGIIAEEIVFGAENVTSGSKSDIETGTQLAATAIKAIGFGDIPGAYQVADKDTNLMIAGDERINVQVESLVRESFELARETLKEHMPLLLEIADHLSDHSCILRDDLRAILQRMEDSPAGNNKNQAREGFPFRRVLKTVVADTREKGKRAEDRPFLPGASLPEKDFILNMKV